MFEPRKYYSIKSFSFVVNYEFVISVKLRQFAMKLYETL